MVLGRWSRLHRTIKSCHSTSATARSQKLAAARKDGMSTKLVFTARIRQRELDRTPALGAMKLFRRDASATRGTNPILLLLELAKCLDHARGRCIDLGGNRCAMPSFNLILARLSIPVVVESAVSYISSGNSSALNASAKSSDSFGNSDFGIFRPVALWQYKRTFLSIALSTVALAESYPVVNAAVPSSRSYGGYPGPVDTTGQTWSSHEICFPLCLFVVPIRHQSSRLRGGWLRFIPLSVTSAPSRLQHANTRSLTCISMISQMSRYVFVTALVASTLVTSAPLAPRALGQLCQVDEVCSRGTVGLQCRAIFRIALANVSIQ